MAGEILPFKTPTSTKHHLINLLKMRGLSVVRISTLIYDAITLKILDK